MSYEGSRRAPSTPSRFTFDGFATPEGPAPKPPLPPVNPGKSFTAPAAFSVPVGSTVQIDTGDLDDRLVPYERAVDLIKNVLVIVTCAAILYTLWVGYRAVSEFGQQLQQLPL